MTEPRAFPELDDVLNAAGRLPLCDGAAKLHALLARVVEAARTGSQIAQQCDALATAAAAALADDPWVQFEAAVRRLQARTSQAAPPRTEVLNGTAPGSGVSLSS